MLKAIRFFRFASLFAVVLLLSACAGSDFKFRDLAKTDTDMVVEAHYQESQRLLRELDLKLYKRNPREWRKSGVSPEKRVAELFAQSGPLQFVELAGVSGTGAIELALDPGFDGDRVFAFIAGLNHMIRQSYGFHSQFYIFTELNEQQLYYSARNVEIAAWRLSQGLGDDGRPLLLSNSISGKLQNLSYERLFGKLIATQDLLADVMAQKNQRFINKVAQNVATMAFFPL